jgi:NADH:ubiquinone oxidoreductase subunit C
MFGIFFRNHPDLRRMLTDYGFKGHPLRKDFPVTGYLETFYNDFNKRIVQEKATFAQEYRIYTLSNNYSAGNLFILLIKCFFLHL